MQDVVTRSAALAALLVTASVSVLIPFQVKAQDSSSAASAASYDFDIPPQSLARAIAELCSVAKLQVLYGAEQPLKLQSHPLKGRYTVDVALNSLLDGSGFSYRFLRAGVFTLERLPQQGTRVLGPVRVEGANANAAAGINGSTDPRRLKGPAATPVTRWRSLRRRPSRSRTRRSR